jgi:uncharacterized protein YfiM (DUF2279 family)
VTPFLAGNFYSAQIQVFSQNADKKPVFTRDSWFSPDKLDHLLFSATLAGSGFLALKVTGSTESDALLLSASSVTSLGLVKEIVDLVRPRGHASWKDLVADLAGVALGVMVVSSL